MNDMKKWPWCCTWMEWRESDIEFFDNYYPYASFFYVLGFIFGIVLVYNEYNEENKGY
jgi:hypothetical protein